MDLTNVLRINDTIINPKKRVASARLNFVAKKTGLLSPKKSNQQFANEVDQIIKQAKVSTKASSTSYTHRNRSLKPKQPAVKLRTNNFLLSDHSSERKEI